MTKTGSTKNKILNIISSGNKTLSDISRELNLAPSTVSQHLQELKDMGAITEVDNPHIKKWKYYQLNPNFDYERSGIGSGIIAEKIKVANKVWFYAIGIAIVAVVAYILISSNSSGTLSSSGNSYVPISLTDPPQVPNGTTSLIATYSSVGVHLVGSNSSGSWITSQTSGKVDLMSLVNVSEVIAGISVPANAAINEVRFNITNANITINGTIYNVTVPNEEITARVSGNEKVNASSGVLVDLSPSVIAVSTNDSTVFVMVPYVKAVLVKSSMNVTTNSSGNVTENVSLTVGHEINLSSNDRYRLSQIKPNITVTGVSLSSTANGSVSLQVTVKNNGNQSVNLDNIFLVGNQTPTFTYNYTCGGQSSNSMLCCPSRIGTPNGPNIFYCPQAGASANTSVQGNLGIQVNRPPMNSSLAGFGNGAIGAAGGIGSNGRYNQEYVGTNLTGNITAGINPGGPCIGLNGKLCGAPNTSITANTTVQYGWGTVTIPIHGNGNYDSNNGYYASVQGQSGTPHFRVNVTGTGSWNSTNAADNVTVNSTALFRLLMPMPSINGFAGVNMHAGSNAQFNRFNMTAISDSLLPGIQAFRGIDFSVESNGTLSLTNQIYAMPVTTFSSNSTYGYTLQPGQSETFTYDAPIALAGNFRIALVSGSQYKIFVYGEDGASATSNVTAS